MPTYNTDEIKLAAKDRWDWVFSQVGVDVSMWGMGHGPCPKCGGNDRFRFFDDGSGGAICNQCFTSHNGDGLSVISWFSGKPFKEVVQEVAELLGVKPEPGKKAKADPEEHLVFQDWTDGEEQVCRFWCIQKPPISVEAVKQVGGRMAVYRKQHKVIALPIRNLSHKTVGWVLYPATGGHLPKYRKGQPPEEVRVKMTYGSQQGWVGNLEACTDAKRIFKLEGCTDVLSMLSVESAAAAICNSNGAKEKPRNSLVQIFKGKDAVVIHDRDKPGLDGATYVGEGDGRRRPGWAPVIARLAETTRHVELPYELQNDHGSDLRDFLVEFELEELRRLIDATDPIEAAGDEEVIDQVHYALDDPHRIARLNLTKYATRHDGATLRYWREEWYVWKDGRYRKITTAELRAKVNASVREEFDEIYRQECRQAENAGNDPPDHAKKVSAGVVGNVMEATKGMCVIGAHVEMDSWIDLEDGVRERRNYITMTNGILDMDAYLGGASDVDHVLMKHSPKWFSITKLPYPFDLECQCPAWKAFLQKTMEGDQQRIDLLQEWAGYLLLPDTGQQKFLVLQGEGANGKSVYCSAIEAMLGRHNCSHVALEQFGDRFMKSATLGKLVNISSDAGDLDKNSEGYLKAFTSGDPVTFDRKGLQPVDQDPTARLMVATNNLPAFKDRTDGIWRRLILVPWNYRIRKSEVIRDMDKVSWWEKSGELPAIFRWAAIGLHRLKSHGWTDSTICDAALHDYQLERNPTREWLTDHYKSAENGSYVVIQDVYRSYREFMSNSGFQPLGMSQFGQEVKRTFEGVQRKQIRAENRKRCYVGILSRGGGQNEFL